MSTDDGDEKTCCSLAAAAAAGHSLRMGGQLDCRPSLAAWSIAPGSIFLREFRVCFGYIFLLLLDNSFSFALCC